MTTEEFDDLIKIHGLGYNRTDTEIRVVTSLSTFVCSISTKMLERITVEDFTQHYLKLPRFKELESQ